MMKKIIITALLVSFSFKIGAQTADNIKVLDTRYDNFAPSYYNNEVIFEFKKRENLGVPGTGTYSGLLTFAPWADNTGGHHHQLNFNEGGLFYRNGLPDTENWGEWSEILTQKANTPIELGPKSTYGGIILAQKYNDDDYIGTLSSNYSSGAIILGYGAAGMKGSGSSGQLVSTFDNFSANRGALRLGQGTLEFLSTPTAVQTAVNSELNVQSRFFINKLGNVGIGTSTPSDKLTVTGDAKITGNMAIGTNVGGAYDLNISNGDNSSRIGFINSNYNENAVVEYHGSSKDLRFQHWNNGSFVNTIMSLNIPNGTVGIGTIDTKGFKLGVNGKIAATEVKVATYNNWPDYVFTKEYKLPTLQEVAQHIKKKGHLQNIPSAKEVKENGGIELGEMNRKLLEKIEELTLYTIQQQKEIEKLKSQNKELLKLSKDIEFIKQKLK